MQLLKAHEKDLGGGFLVRRLLPAATRRSVGPFVFFDHFGPATERPAGPARRASAPAHRPGHRDLPVRGRDDAPRQPRASVQEIRPGAINWMTAGRGIVHSERKPERLRERQLCQPRPAAVGRRCRRPHEEVRAELFAYAGSGHSGPGSAGRPGAGADRRGLRGAIAGQDLLADAVSRHRAAGRRALRAAGAGARTCRSIRSTATARRWRRGAAAFTMAVLAEGEGARLEADAAGAPGGGRRRPARRPALHRPGTSSPAGASGS